MSATATAKIPARLDEVQDHRRSLADLIGSSELGSIVVGVSKDPNAKITVLLLHRDTGAPVFAVKVPTTPAGAAAVRREARVLVEVWARASGRVRGTIPRLIEMVPFEGNAAAVMTAMGGTPMTTRYLRWRHTANPARVAADFALAEAWLSELQRGTAASTAPLDMNGDVVSRLCERFAGDPGLAEDVDRLDAIHARLAANTVARTAVHGDFWFGNVLVADERVTGVVDWEAGAIAGEPTRDLVRFALSYAMYLDRRTRARRRVAGHAGLRAGAWGAGVEYAITGDGWFPNLFRQFIRDGLARLGAAPASWRDAAIAGVAEVAALTDDPDFARLNLNLFQRLAYAGQDRKEGK